MKWQMVPQGGGKFQMVFHLQFAICDLNFEFLFQPVGEPPAPRRCENSILCHPEPRQVGAKDLCSCFLKGLRTTAEMLRFAQHDSFRILHNFPAPQPLALRANPSPHGPFPFSLFWRQDSSDLPAGGLTNLGGLGPRFPLREGRIRTQIIKLFVPFLEDGKHLCLLLLRQVEARGHPLKLALGSTVRGARLLRGRRRSASLLPGKLVLPESN
jgi:hypothetical protein